MEKLGDRSGNFIKIRGTLLGKSKINFTEEKLIELLKDSSITLTSKFDVQLLADIDVLGISFEG